MYTILISEFANRQIKKIDNQYRKQIKTAIASLAENPRPHGYIKLKDRAAYRIRTGDYRIIYEIHDKKIEVAVIDVGHRKDIYQ